MVKSAGDWKKINYFKTLKISTFSRKLWKKWNITWKLYSFLVWYLCSIPWQYPTRQYPTRQYPTPRAIIISCQFPQSLGFILPAKIPKCDCIPRDSIPPLIINNDRISPLIIKSDHIPPLIIKNDGISPCVLKKRHYPTPSLRDPGMTYQAYLTATAAMFCLAGGLG